MKTLLIAALFFCSSTVLAAETKAQPATQVTLALNWKAEPEFGGFYAGALQGTYLKHGISINIQEGGSGTPTVQMLANGKVDFAIVSADEIILSQDRNPKNKVVALFAVYQTAPYIIMSHAEAGHKSLKDVFNSEGTLAVQSGLPFYQYLVQKLGKPKVSVVPYLGGVANFVNDKKFSQQGFIAIEPLVAEKSGAKVKSFLVADEGFNPYVVVLAARAETIKKNPELIRNMVSATRMGWQSYLANPLPANDHMSKLNRSLDLAAFNKGAEIQRPLIESKGQPLGLMTTGRWDTLVQQMKDLKLIKSTPKGSDLYFP